MEIHLNPEGLGPRWPSLPNDAKASLGISAGPPLHLLGVLETVLGLSGKFLDPEMRAAALVPIVRDTSGFFAASALADPLGVAKTLLRWRDRLWLQGWRAEPVTRRLAELAVATVDVEPGIPDRLLAVLAALGERHAGIDRITLVEDRGSLPWLWREVLAALERQGTEVELRPPVAVAARGDLQRLRHGQVPEGDGSVQLFRAPGPRMAADAVAAWLVAQTDWRDTVVIGGDAVLDHALRRHGLPTLGRPEGGDRPVTQTLRLALSLGWSPADPQRAYELLTLSEGPVPKPLADRLIRALQRWPAVDSDAWREAMREGLAAIPEEGRRRRVDARVSVLLEMGRGPEYAKDLAERKAEAVRRWCRGRASAEAGTALGRAYEMAGGVAFRFLKLLRTTERPMLTAPELEQLLSPADASVMPPPAWPAGAGLAGIEQPGALLGQARRVVWWSFARERVPSARLEIPLYPDEVEALDRRGVHLWPPVEQAKREAQRWRRPLEQTTNSLLLVCPHRGEDGRVLHLHPLWDEIACQIPTDALKSLVVESPSAGCRVPLVRRERLPFVRPRRDWRVPAGRVRARAKPESPSSLGMLLGCSLAYALRYAAGLRPQTVVALPRDAVLLGTLAHHLIAEVLIGSRGKDPRALAEEATTKFDQEGVRLAASLFRPGSDADRATVRAVIERATTVLASKVASSPPSATGPHRNGRDDRADGTVVAIMSLMMSRTAPSPTMLSPDASTLERFRVAVRALFVLKDENDDPHWARLLHLAMDEDTYGRLASTMRGSADGRTLLDERRTIPEGVTLDSLAALPDGTLGQRWVTYYRDQGIQPFTFDFAVEDDAHFLAKRYRETHDIHHLITGYGIDPLGEVELQAFYWGNLGFRHAALIVFAWVLGAQFKYLPLRRVPESLRRIRRAYRRGKASRMILAVPFDRMWGRPVVEIAAETLAE